MAICSDEPLMRNWAYHLVSDVPESLSQRWIPALPDMILLLPLETEPSGRSVVTWQYPGERSRTGFGSYMRWLWASDLNTRTLDYIFEII
jgi:hypothetical protein